MPKVNRLAADFMQIEFEICLGAFYMMRAPEFTGPSGICHEGLPSCVGRNVAWLQEAYPLACEPLSGVKAEHAFEQVLRIL